MVKERHSAKEIGEYGYSHWTGRPVTPGAHKIWCVPQTIADGWDAYCSCGEWRGFANFYDFDTTDEIIAALKSKHDEHAKNSSA